MTQLIGIDIQPTDYQQVTQIILRWVHARVSKYICIANVHMLMESFDSAEYKKIINNAALVLPDGMPLVWTMRLKGQKNQERVYGPTLMLKVLESAEQENIAVGFYGSTPQVIRLLVENLKKKFQNLNIVYSFSPKFSNDLQETDIEIAEMKKSGLQILFVGLGCPKQEIWMAKYCHQMNVVMLGVGAAFDFHAGTKPQAPSWLQKIGLEWFFRFLTEPRRLWKRYLYHNPRFILLAILNLLGLVK